MKYFIIFLSIAFLFGFRKPSEPLTPDEADNIKNQIIERSEKHAGDLENMDFESVMKFYNKEYIAFGDGYYWGDYTTVYGVWKDILEGGWKDILYWDLQNHKIHVFSENAASYLVEFDHKHLEQNGDTVGSSGCFTYGMEKIDGEWKAVTGHVTHIPERTNDNKWWSKHAPSNRTRQN